MGVGVAVILPNKASAALAELPGSEAGAFQRRFWSRVSPSPLQLLAARKTNRAVKIIGKLSLFFQVKSGHQFRGTRQTGPKNRLRQERQKE